MWLILALWRLVWWHRRDRQLAGLLIGHQFKSADVAAVEALRLRAITLVPDLDLTGWTLPRHRDANANVRLSSGSTIAPRKLLGGFQRVAGGFDVLLRVGSERLGADEDQALRLDRSIQQRAQFSEHGFEVI